MHTVLIYGLFIAIKLIKIYVWILFARVLLSWIIPVVKIRNPLVLRGISAVYKITDVLIKPIDRIIPPIGPLNISVIVAYLLLWALEEMLMSTLRMVLSL